ncbi:MAG: tetratricopeptide repeat protein [Spirulina sp.]
MQLQKKIPSTDTILSYRRSIENLSREETPGLSQILAVLTSRDLVEASRRDFSELTGEDLAELVELDDRLRGLAGAIATHPQLAQCRQTVKPPETAWWWFLEAPAPPPPQPSKLARLFQYDWVWNTITVACLVGAGTYATNTIRAFSNDNLDLLQTFSTISQGAGLVLVTGGTLTQKGQNIIRDTLVKIGIKSQYQAEVTCGLAVLLLSVTFGVNAYIPKIGKYFYEMGKTDYNEGEINKARINLEKAQSLDPNNAKISIDLGNIYATFSLYKEADRLYQVGIMAGQPRAFNGAGRVQLRMATTFADLVNAESLFRLGLAQPKVPRETKAAMLGHLGFTLIRQVEMGNLSEEEIQKHYTEAEEKFKKGLAIASKIEAKHPGMGMSHCYLGILYDKQGKTAEARTAWQDCQDNAMPASQSQYQDIVIYGSSEVAQKVDVTKIVRISPRTLPSLKDLGNIIN